MKKVIGYSILMAILLCLVGSLVYVLQGWQHALIVICIAVVFTSLVCFAIKLIND